MNDYTNVVLRVQSGDKEAENELFNLVKRDYYGMVSGLPEGEASEKFRSVFDLTLAHINEVGNPDVYGEWFKMTLEQNMSGQSAQAGQSGQSAQAGQAGQYGQPGQNMQAGQYGQPGQNMQAGQYGQPGQNMQAGQYGQPGQNMQAGQYGQPGQDMYGQAPYMATEPVKKKSKAPLIIGICAAIVVVAVAVVLIVKFAGGKDYEKDGYKDLLDIYFEAYSDEDMDTMIDCYPKEIGETVRSSFMTQAGGDEEDFWAMMESGYGSDFEITYEITDSEEVSSSDTKELEDAIKDTYDAEYDLDYVVKLKLEEDCTGSLYSYSYTEKVYAAVIDGEWYFLGTAY